MSKIVRLDEDVYSELKARATQEGKTLSKAIIALMQTNRDSAIETRLAALELKLDELKHDMNEVLIKRVKTGEEALTASEGMAQASTDVITKNEPHSTKQSEAKESPQSIAESFIIHSWLVSCAASGSRFACASPGSVAAYHGALSRLRLGFKSRLGRSFFAFF